MLPDISRSNTSAVVDHYDIRPVINIYGNVDGKDLGYVSEEVQQLVDASKKDLPRGSLLVLRGQTKTMQSSFSGLYWGLAFSIVLIYLLGGGEFPVLDWSHLSSSRRYRVRWPALSGCCS